MSWTSRLTAVRMEGHRRLAERQLRRHVLPAARLLASSLFKKADKARRVSVARIPKLV